MSNKRITFNELNSTIIFGFDQLKKEFVYIDDCENGLNCNLVCPFCNSPLNAKNHCQTKSNHFAHKAGSDCRQGHESTLPLLLEKVLRETRKIHLPDYHCPSDYSIYESYGYINIKTIELEKYDEDLSFNVIIESVDGKRVAILPYMKSINLVNRKIEANKKYNNVLAINFKDYKNTNLFVEDVIRELVLSNRYFRSIKWVTNENLKKLNEKYDAKQKRKLLAKKEGRNEKIAVVHKEPVEVYKEQVKERKEPVKPVVIGGVTYYKLKDINELSKTKKTTKIKHRFYDIAYFINFEEDYISGDGYILGKRIDKYGNISNKLEKINYLKDSQWSEF